MSLRTPLRMPFLVFALGLALACGGGSKPDNGPGDADIDLPDVAPDGGGEDVGTDTPDPLDDGANGDEATPGDPGKGEDVQPGDECVGCDAVDAKDAEVSEDVPLPPLCPCDETIPDAQVCVRDPATKVRTEYKTEVCAKCALCAADEETCKGCTGSKTDCKDLPQPNYITWKGTCYDSLCGGCRKEDECDRLVYPSCGPVCGLQGATPTTYDDLCEMKDAFDCDDGYDENLLNFGACPAPACEPCLGLAENPVCGSDGKTYKNQCEIVNCPSVAGVTRTCLGACVGADFCAACPTECSPVCGDDGITYGSACAATKCGTKGKLVDYNGPCCPECAGDPEVEVCATNGKPYKNMCLALCQGATPCPDTNDPACGLDGTTYKNSCWASCKAGGQLHQGACTRICEQCPATWSPVCALNAQGNPQTYQSECFKTCLGGTGTSAAGVCSACTTLCQNAPAQTVCGADKITYANACIPEKCLGLTWTNGACP